MLHPQLAVRTIVSALMTPTAMAMAFLGKTGFPVLAKNTDESSGSSRPGTDNGG